MNTPLIKQYHYNTPTPQVWKALTDPAAMRTWYFPQLQQFEPTVGYHFRFEDPGAAYQKEWIVTQVVAGQTLAHSWAYRGHPGISEVTFDLAADGDHTILTVTQTGLESFPDHPHFRRERFEQGWDSLLGHNLKNLLEKQNTHP